MDARPCQQQRCVTDLRPIRWSSARSRERTHNTATHARRDSAAMCESEERVRRQAANRSLLFIFSTKQGKDGTRKKWKLDEERAREIGEARRALTPAGIHRFRATAGQVEGSRVDRQPFPQSCYIPQSEAASRCQLNRSREKEKKKKK